MNAGDVSHSRWRLFVALCLPKQVQFALAEMQAELRALIAPGGASWPKQENLHLTLRFLGEVLVSQADELIQALRREVSATDPLELVCERLGCFPDLSRPRVIWAGVRDVDGRLIDLADTVNRATSPFTGQPMEDRFVGHITLGRVKRIRRREIQELSKVLNAAANQQFGSWQAPEIELLRSELSSGGSRYTRLATVPLRN